MQQELAKRYRELFEIFTRHPQITRVTFWGTTDANTWLNNFPVRGRTNHPMPWDRQYKPKPAFDAVYDVLKTAYGNKQSASDTSNSPSPIPAKLEWVSSDILVPPPSAADRNILAIKDPSIVRFEGRWHIYATIVNSQGNWRMVYLSFTDWNEAVDAVPYFLDENPVLRGYHCAPPGLPANPIQMTLAFDQSHQPDCRFQFYPHVQKM